MEQQHQYDSFRGIGKSSRAAYLIAGYIIKNLTIAEEEELDNWLGQNENMNLFFEITDEEKPVARQYLEWYDKVDLEKRLSNARKTLGLQGSSKVTYIWQYTAAACLVAFIIAAGLYFFDFKKTEKPFTQDRNAKDLQPGTTYAQLKTSGGHTFSLRPGLDTVIDGSTLIKNGEVISTTMPANSGFHELVIPRKGHFKLVLPDGTRVFLNAESSIKYPLSFGNTREVTVTGETYFEVAKDPHHPFVVNVNALRVEALGTAFNINAYNNEDGITATLVEGAVKVSDDTNEKLLKPGDKIRINTGKWNISKGVDTAPITAWTKNVFKLKNAPMKEVMRMIERWYDATVIYKTSENIHFNGTISRDVPVSHLLKLLQETGDVKFTINGNDIIISK